MSVLNFFSLLGGLALFLFGMDTMGNALEKQAGGRLQTILSRLTDNPLKGFGLGLAVTAVIQSSSATTVMVVGFVNSGIMQLHQAIGIIIGSNVGTTVTSWLLSLTGLEGDSLFITLLKPSSFSPVLAFIGIVLYMFCKSEKKKGVGTILIGFAVLMTGMETMSGAVKPLANEPWFTDLFLAFSNPILGILAGAILTAIIQSSSASVGILQALCATGVVTYATALPIVMGQNIGTCATALISSVGANKDARRVAIVHLYFNVIGVIFFSTIYYTLNAVIGFGFVNESASAVGIAVIHSTFNILASFVMLPFSALLEKLAMLTIKDDKKPDQFQLLDERLLSTPAVATDRARVVTCDMAEVARMSLLQAMSLTHNFSAELADKVDRQEDSIDHYEDQLGTYLVKLSACDMTMADSHSVNTLLHTISDFERIGDHAANLCKTAREMNDKQIIFSDAAQRELGVLEAAIQDLIDRTITSFEKNDMTEAAKVEPMEQVIDDLVRQIKTRHIARLQAGTCSIEYGFVLNDLLTNYERVADHCSNIAVAMIEVAQNSFDTHAYLGKIKEGDEAFNERFAKYLARYPLSKES